VETNEGGGSYHLSLGVEKKGQELYLYERHWTLPQESLFLLCVFFIVYGQNRGLESHTGHKTKSEDMETKCKRRTGKKTRKVTKISLFS
jgi:hypothetical protein